MPPLGRQHPAQGAIRPVTQLRNPDFQYNGCSPARYAGHENLGGKAQHIPQANHPYTYKSPIYHTN